MMSAAAATGHNMESAKDMITAKRNIQNFEKEA
jgi:hypothetical protein